MENLRKRFFKDGYLIIRGLLDEEEIVSLRKVCDDYKRRTKNMEMLSSEFLSVPELARIPLNPKVLATLKELLGPRYTLFPNFTMRSGLYTGWHIDAAFNKPQNHLFNKDFLHVQSVVYLQDNDPAMGGGLDVKPGSHRKFINCFGHQSNLSRRLRKYRNEYLKEVTVDSKAGDLVLWHARLLHKSTANRVTVRNENKFGIFWSAAKSNDSATHYLSHLKSKSKLRLNGMNHFNRDRFIELLKMKYPPEDYPSNFVKMASSHKIKVGSLV